MATQNGVRWVMASTPAAPASEIAAVGTEVPKEALVASTSSDPAAAPVASEGVSIPPTAPARKNKAVRSGFNASTMAAAVMVMPLFKVTVRMLRPLPGNSGHQCEQIRPVQSGVTMSLRTPDCHREARGDQRGAQCPRVPGFQHDPGDEQSAAQRDGIHRTEAGRGTRPPLTMTSASRGTSVLDLSIHQPSAANTPPAIGPSTRRTGLLAVTPASNDPNV